MRGNLSEDWGEHQGRVRYVAKGALEGGLVTILVLFLGVLVLFTVGWRPLVPALAGLMVVAMLAGHVVKRAVRRRQKRKDFAAEEEVRAIREAEKQKQIAAMKAREIKRNGPDNPASKRAERTT